MSGTRIEYMVYCRGGGLYWSVLPVSTYHFVKESPVSIYLIPSEPILSKTYLCENNGHAQMCAPFLYKIYRITIYLIKTPTVCMHPSYHASKKTSKMCWLSNRNFQTVMTWCVWCVMRKESNPTWFSPHSSWSLFRSSNAQLLLLGSGSSVICRFGCHIRKLGFSRCPICDHTYT